MLILVLDLETTSFAPPEGGIGSGVCEIGWTELVSDTDMAGAPCNWRVGNSEARLVNPGRPIPPETSAIHHIVDGDVIGAPPWPTVLDGLFDPRPDAVAAHSTKFERQWLTDELTGALPWLCTYKAALRLWPDAPSHSNQCLRYWRKPHGLDRGLAQFAHRAGPEAYVTAHLLRDMLNDGAKVEDLIAWTKEPALQVTCHIGKYRGTKWREVDRGFLYWVSERDFDEDVIFTVRTELDRREKEREAERAQMATADEDDRPF